MRDTRETQSTYQSENASIDPFNKLPARAPARLRVVLAGGTTIIRKALEGLIESKGIVVAGVYERPEDVAAAIGQAQPDALVLILASTGPFEALHRIREALANAADSVPLVVLASKLDRAQVYTALRIGARSYISDDSDPEELVRAIRTVAAGSVYLSPEAADLLVSDISHAQQDSPGKGRVPSVELSKRELEIVHLLCEGLSGKEVARRLHISAKTVENHRYNIYRKWEVDSIAGLIRYAVTHGLVTL